MVTNILAFLHTTAAYQAAAMQLMVGQANFATKQLDLREPLPIVAPANTNQWNVTPLPMGVGGMLLASNYNFDFRKGHFLRISEKDWLKKVFPPATNLDCLTNRISLVDTNGAYELATHWLSCLSVDVGALERKFPPHVAQDMTYVSTTNQFGKMEVIKVPIPIYDVSWNKSSQPTLILGMNPVSVKIFGPTKELLSLRFRGDMLDQIPFASPPLTVTNAAALLGPLPPPDHFVKQLFGGGAAYETVKSPDYVEAWLLHTGPDEDGKQTVRGGPKKLWAWTAKSFSNILLDFNSYAWGEMKLCDPDFGLRLRFTRGDDQVEFLLCYNCDILEVTHNGHRQQENFDFAHDKLVRAVQSAFPWDQIISKLKSDPEAKERHKEYEGMLNQ